MRESKEGRNDMYRVLCKEYGGRMVDSREYQGLGEPEPSVKPVKITGRDPLGDPGMAARGVCGGHVEGRPAAVPTAFGTVYPARQRLGVVSDDSRRGGS